MGRRVIQRIYKCDVCGKVPDEGTYLWEMPRETYICEDCNEKESDEA